MSEPADQPPEEIEEEEEGRDKRLLFLLFLVLLVIIGAWFGTIAFPGVGPCGDTPTPDGGPQAPSTTTPTQAENDTVTPTPTPTEEDKDADSDNSDDDGTATPTTTATPTATPTASGGGGGGSSSVDLTADGSTVLVQASDVAPGHAGQNSITFENSGDVGGELLVDDTSVTDDENSLLDPEKAVGDDATTGELSSALQVRLSVEYADGTTKYLFGTANSYVTLQSIDGANRTSSQTLDAGEQATVTFEWTLPRSTGNEIQSDGAEFDVDFVLRQTS